MEFKSYSSIENHYRERFIDRLRMNGLENVEYELTEKIHGANFSFWYDGEELKVASRGQFVDGTFYGCQSVIDKYADAVKDIWISLFEPRKGDILVIYGELYGPKIQKGINYGSQKDFIAFDMRINGVMEPAGSTRKLLTQTEMPYVPILGLVDSLTEALNWNNTFVSRLGELNGVDDSTNIAEGFVIKPMWADNMYIGMDRVILKSKNDKWSEKIKVKREPKVRVDDPLVPLIEPYVNANRLGAVVSKLGNLTPKDFGLVIKEMTLDVIADMVKDGDAPEDWKRQDAFQSLGQSVNNVVIPFLKRELLPKL